MKKSTLKVLSLVMAIAMILGTLTAIPFSALPGSNGPVAVEEHVHTKSGDAIKVVEPTCTLYGYSVYECECGKTFIADVTEKTEHNYQEVGEIPADCATGTVGYTAGVKCVVCGDVKSGCFEIEPEHKDAYRIIDGTYKFDEEGNVVTTPDCTAGVTYQHYCAACGQILENNVNTIVDYLNNQDDDHDYTIEVRDDAPTCEEGGYLYVVCEREGAYYFGDCAYEGPVAIYVAALGHDWSDPIEDEYGDPFKKYTQCTRCGAIEEIPEPEEPDDDDDPEHPVQPDCHNWVSNGFVFSIGGEANLSSREFTGTAAEYLTQYAIYSNISDLYELFACTICNRTRLVLRVEKLDKEHLYGDYTFNFEGKVLTLNPEYDPQVEDSQMYLTTEFGVHNPDYDPEDEESEEYLIDPFSVVLRGGIYTEYACNEKTVTTKVCAFCDALGIEPTENDIEESDNELAHRYSEYWLCQNEECKKMVKVGTTTDEQTGEEVDVFEEERPMVSVDLGTNGIITLPLTDGYYKCGDCTHDHVTKVCFNPFGTLVERENWTLTVIGDDTTPEATPDLPKVYEQLFEIELDKEEAKKDYSDIALCLDLDGAQFVATEHEFGKNVIETGDCQTKTVEYKICKICGSKYDIVEGEYGDHNWTEWEHLNPTCQQYECDQRHCTICDLYEEKNVGEYGDHQLGEWETVQEADCQHQEIKERYCTVDGCEYFEREVGEFGDHDMEFIVDKDANCVDTGKGHYTCSVCGVAGEKNVEIAIDADNHKGPVTAETTVEPTCTEEGVRVYTCTACGESWEEEIEKIPHDWDIIEAKEATCFEAGNKRYERCKVCGEYGKDEETGEEFKGELILAYKHEGYIAEKTLENGDVAKEATVWVAVTDPNFKAKDYALRIRAVEVETKVEEEVEYYGYTIRYVEPTCTRDGYVIGKYCTKCAEIYGNEDLIADIEGEFNYTGYIIPATGNHKIVHIVSDPEALPTFDGVCGGEVYYAYAVDYCVVCGKYYQEEAEDNEGFEPVYFDMLTAKEHRPEFDDELFDETGALEPVIYTVVFDGEAFIELTADNAEDYPDCTYARYTAKKCRFCGKYFDITLKTEAFGHYYVNDGQGNKLFLMDCDKYDAKYVGVACSACGGIVPEYSVEPITEGEFTGYARECYWVSLDGSNMVPTYDRQLVKALGYLLVEHNNIAATQSVCDGYVIIECADCGLTFVNIEIEGIEHEYLLREGGYDAFKLEDYDKYAFDNVVYPTVTSEGFGTLTCIKCGEVLEVTIPALTAELSVSFDDFDEIIREDLGEYGIKNVIVGDEVTATIKITAKNFKFHNFKIFIDTWTDHFDLVGVEVLYDFGDVNAVNSYVDNGYVYLDCINSIGNAVVEEANDAEFLRITFKSGDLTYEDACTAFSWGIDEAEYSVIDEDGDVDYGYAGLANDGWFGGDINVYNPDYYYSAIEVLEAAYNDGYAAQYDFNKDGRVDLVDYFAMVDYITSAQTIADFCELIGYDLEAVIDGLEYRDALNKCEVVNTPDGPLTIYRTLDNLKDNVRIAFASANYRESIIEAGVTIAQFAQNVINNI